MMAASIEGCGAERGVRLKAGFLAARPHCNAIIA